MPLSKSGRVAIVDDKYEEVAPLMQALGKQGVPYLYYNGNVKTLPEQVIAGIRFVFLDIELDGMEGQNEKSKASKIVGVLKKLIGVSNEPYVIIFWTTHHNVIDKVLENCKSKGIPPVASIDLDKADYLTGIDSIQKITEALDSKLKDIGAFQLYTEWENLIHSSASQVVGEFSEIAKEETGEMWSKKTASLFFTLYKNYVDKNITNDNSEKFKLSCHLLNRNFLGLLESNTALKLMLPEGLKIDQAMKLSDIEKAKLNKTLFIGDSLSSKPSTGDIYIEKNNDGLLKDLEKAMFKSDAPSDCQLCKVVLTPECDIAQNKTMKVSSGEKEVAVHRVVYGLLCTKKDNNKSGSRYRVGPIEHEKKIIYLYFFFAMLEACKESDFHGAPLFTMKRDLCFDLQSKAANHVNRLGEYQFV